MRRRPFFRSSPELGGKITNFRIEIKLSSLNKFRKRVSPLRNLLNQRKIDAYGYKVRYWSFAPSKFAESTKNRRLWLQGSLFSANVFNFLNHTDI